jgi:hypothetical protein
VNFAKEKIYISKVVEENLPLLFETLRTDEIKYGSRDLKSEVIATVPNFSGSNGNDDQIITITSS